MAKWTIDPAHTIIGFKIKHLVISTVKGRFNEFAGKVETKDDSFENALIEFTANTASISTNNEARDNHLRSPDMFDSSKFPEMKFISSSFTKTSDNKFKVIGDLTIKGVTKSITFDASFEGIVMGLYGKRVAAFSLSGIINRLDFGVAWNAVMETGGLVVANEVNLDIEVELTEEVIIS
jgi:polyisoprenoid-binding protein YceI